jgi:hypothetical protein
LLETSYLVLPELVSFHPDDPRKRNILFQFTILLQLIILLVAQPLLHFPGMLQLPKLLEEKRATGDQPANFQHL